MALTRKRLLLIGFILILLIGIPVTLFVVQQQQEVRSRAQQSTILYYQPETSQAAPLQKNLGDTFTLDVYANPGVNLINSIRLEITYDPTKLATASAAGSGETFIPDPQALPNVIFGPAYGPGKISVTLDAGSDPTNFLDTITKVATIYFKAIAPTNGTPTQVAYNTTITRVTSSAGESSNNTLGDQYGENVLSSTNPAFIAIADGGVITPIPSGVTPSISVKTPTPTSPITVITPTPIRGLSPTIVVVSGPPGPQGPEGPQGPQGPAGSDGTILTATPSATPFIDNGTIDNPPTATPTLEPSGPGETVLGFGAVLAVLTIIGGILFFAL